MSEDENAEEKKISEFNEKSLRDIAREIVGRRLGLRIHWIAYILVNILLFVINYFTNFSYYWFLWPLTCWGVAIAIHTFSYVVYRRGLVSTTAGGLIAYHTFIFIVVNLLLLFINWFTSSPHAINWFFWPLGCWGAGLIVHWVFYLNSRPKNPNEAHKSWMDRQIDEELARVKKP